MTGSPGTGQGMSLVLQEARWGLLGQGLAHTPSRGNHGPGSNGSWPARHSDRTLSWRSAGVAREGPRASVHRHLSPEVGVEQEKKNYLGRQKAGLPS